MQNKLAKYKGINGAIFDIDGTIVDSMPTWYVAGASLLDKYNIKADDELGRTLFSLTIEETAVYLKETYGIDLSVGEIIDAINEAMRVYYGEKVQAKPGMIDLIKTFSENGIKLTVATSTDRDTFMPCFERLGLTKYFDRLFTCTEVGQSKSNPEIFLQALDFMGTKPKETYLFEDGLYSAKTAKKLGIKIVAVYDEVSKHDWEEFKKIADVVIEKTPTKSVAL